VLVETVVAIFDGEVLHRFTLKQPHLEDARVELLLDLIRPRA
jgi:hypothetical protein